MHQPTATGIPAQQAFLQELKRQTSAQHEALERNPYSAALVSPMLERERYLEILQRFYGFVFPVEQTIYPLLEPVLGNTDKFLRSEWLRQDLVVLGMSPSAIDLLPLLPALPPSRTMAEAFGVVYVPEGSKLGGQFISRQLTASLGLTPDTGLRFFNGHGRDTGLFWNEFRQAMADFALRSSQSSDIITAAVSAFEIFTTWLKPGTN